MATGSATEIASLPLKDGTDVYDLSSPAYNAWQESLSILSKVPGVQNTYHGTRLEDPSILELLVGASVDAFTPN
jgi:hypothetical protein